MAKLDSDRETSSCTQSLSPFQSDDAVGVGDGLQPAVGGSAATKGESPRARCAVAEGEQRGEEAKPWWQLHKSKKKLSGKDMKRT